MKLPKMSNSITYSVCELLIEILFFTIPKYLSIGLNSGVYYGSVMQTIPVFSKNVWILSVRWIAQLSITKISFDRTTL